MLTAAEGARLADMAQGLINRYQQASQLPPLLLYVDRDCCSAATKRLFSAWPDLLIHLDGCSNLSDGQEGSIAVYYAAHHALFSADFVFECRHGSDAEAIKEQLNNSLRDPPFIRVQRDSKVTPSICAAELDNGRRSVAFQSFHLHFHTCPID